MTPVSCLFLILDIFGFMVLSLPEKKTMTIIKLTNLKIYSIFFLLFSLFLSLFIVMQYLCCIQYYFNNASKRLM